MPKKACNPFVDNNTEETARRISSGLNALMHFEDICEMNLHSQQGFSLILQTLHNAARQLVLQLEEERNNEQHN